MSTEQYSTDAPDTPSSLEQVRLRFESWRQRRKKRTSTPKSLWVAAVALSGEYSISHLSRVLGVNYTALKKRIQKTNNVDFSASEAPSATFLELPFPSSTPVLECTVEILRNDGAIMRMHLKGNTGSDLLELGKAFWSNGS